MELIRLESAVEFRYQYQQDKLRQEGQADQNNRETRYRELLDLSGEMAFGHRNLVDLTGSIQLGLEDIQTRSDTDQFYGHESDFVNLYDLNALVLGTSWAPTNVFARREQSLLDRPFAGTIDETTTEEGIGTRIQSSVAPTSVQYLHREDRIKGDFGAIDSVVNQDTLTLQSAITLTPNQRVDATYTFDRISESAAGGYTDSYDRHDVNLVHTATFGDENRPHELRSSLRLYDQSGKQSQDHLRWDELLTLRHSDRLETRYALTVDTQKVRDETQQLTRGEASVRYHLFDSLTSVGSVGAQRVSSPGGFTSDDVFVNGELDYTKSVPYGRLDATVGLSYDQQTNSDRGSTQHIVNENYTFIDGLPVVIPRRNIVPGSVVITPTVGFPVYQEGLDYTLSLFTDHAEVRGIVGGGFVNGQTLLISYDVGPEAGSDIDTTSTNVSVRYSITEGWLDGAAVYGVYRTVGHSVRANDPSQFTLDDVKDLLLGVEYRFAEFDLKYEYNNHDSTLSPYTINRFQGIYALPLGPSSALNVQLTREIIDFTNENNRVTFDRGTLRWNERLSQVLDLEARLEYRNEDSSLNGRTEGFDQTLGLTWHKRQTTVFTSVRNSFLDGPGTHQTSQFLQFGIRRTF